MRSRYRRGLLDGIARERAREMRREATAGERKLWSHLRRKSIGGVRFRRQHPLFGFIADFCCAEARIVVELDGDSHAARADYDRWRTRELNRRGYRVVRFLNQEVIENIEGVIEKIWEEIQAPPPRSSPVAKNGGGGGVKAPPPQSSPVSNNGGGGGAR